jgi:integrase
LINETTGFANIEDAKRWAEDRVRALREGNLGWNPKHVPTVQTLFDTRIKTPYDDRLEPFVAAHAQIKVTQITPETCKAWIATRLAMNSKFGRPFSPGTIRTECAWLRAFFNQAVGTRKWLRENPWSMVDKRSKVKLPRKSVRERILRIDEQPELLAALGGAGGPLSSMIERMAKIILGSGLRRHEICCLQPAMVHHGALHLPEWLTKGKKARTVPVGADVLALIETQRLERTLDPRSQDRLFPIDEDYFSEAIRKACAAAQIEPPITPHDLRRTYASRMAFKVPVKVLALLMGHSDSSVKILMAHYTQVDEEKIAAMVASVGSPIAG